MHIRILGSAAGGGFPQWNCGCGNCVAVRRKDAAFKARTQAQLALSADGVRWFLAGASPDLARQIESDSKLHPRASHSDTRDSPLAGVILSSADLDHVLGLLLLRELQPLRVYAAPSILKILREQNSMFGMLNRVDPQVSWEPIVSDIVFPLLDASGSDLGLTCELIPLSSRYPKYVKLGPTDPDRREASGALIFTASGKKVVYIPATGDVSEALLAKIQNADLLLFDGTFWSDDELRRVQGSGETAHQMGHIPIEESLLRLKDVRAGRKMFIHLNNTNPVLNEAGPERRHVHDAGWEVAEDQWHLEL